MGSLSKHFPKQGLQDRDGQGEIDAERAVCTSGPVGQRAELGEQSIRG